MNICNQKVFLQIWYHFTHHKQGKLYFDIKTSRFFWYPTPWKWDWWFIVRQEIGAHGCKCFDLCKLFFFKWVELLKLILSIQEKKSFEKKLRSYSNGGPNLRVRFFFQTISPISFVFMRLIRLIAAVIVCK